MYRSSIVRTPTVFLVGTLLVLTLFATPAFAQGPYVGASFLGNIVRMSGLLSEADGATPGLSLRVGTPIGERWGVDAEYVYPGRLDSEGRLGQLADGLNEALSVLAGPSFPLTSLVYFPGEISETIRHSTFSALGWVSQRPNDRVELVYLGGVTFGMTGRRLQVRFPDPLPFGPGLPSNPFLPGLRPIPPGDIDQESTSYEVGPSVGMDARIRMTDHLRLVPGVRLTAFDGTLIIRPAVGLHWVF
jgi:hypothetical protein